MNKENYELAVQLRHELHQHPELSNNEAWTKEHLIKFLKEHTKLEIVDRESWFYAVQFLVKNINPNVVIKR
jgi:metal-dependent amidase/aminoacylase/carboxypeptidase family protein